MFYFTSFTCCCPIIPIPCFKKTVPPPFNGLSTLVENPLKTCMTLFQDSQLYSIICLSLCRFDYHWFILSLKSGSVNIPVLLVFKRYFGCSESLAILYEF